LKARPQVKKRKKDFANSYCDHLQNAVKGCDKGRNVMALWWQISKAERYQLWERCLPAMNDNAECLTKRVANIAGKRAPTGSVMVCACQTEASDSRASLAPTGDTVFWGTGACPR